MPVIGQATLITNIMHTPFRALREIYNPYSPYMPYKDRYDIQQQPDVNSTIGPVDRQDATLEAEVGEVALKPDLSGVYHISGKKHSQGGTPLNLDPGSFIFSNDKTLRFTPEEKKIFEFKKGGTTQVENTPARILKREIPLADYNRYSDISQNRDNDNDNVARNSAGLMLQKYQEKMGQVAFVQEAKKGFPTGVPDFSKNTAPVYDPQTETKLDQNKQYMRYGGWMNPYTDRMMTFAEGGPGPIDPITGLPIKDTDRYPGGKTPAGSTTPKGLSNSFNYPGGVSSLVDKWKTVGVDLGPLNTHDAQQAMYDWAYKNNPEMLRQMWGKYGDTAQGKRLHLPSDFNNMSDRDLSAAASAYTDGLLGARTFSPGAGQQATLPPPAAISTTPGNPITAGPANPATPEFQQPFGPNPYQPSTTLPYNPRVPLSPLQKANLLYSGYQAMTVPRYNPYRSQVQSPLVELARYNPEPALNAVRSSAAQAYSANSLQNPYLSGTNNADIFGKSLEAQQSVLGNYADRNVGVANQQAMTNNQIQRQDQMFNTESNQRYYDQTQQLAQNYNNEKRFATNQTASMLNGYVSQNQALEQMLASQRTYGRTQIGTDKNGNPVYQAKPLYDVDFSGISPHVYYTGAGSLNGIPYMSNRLYDFGAFAQEMKNAGIDPNSVVGARYYAATKGQPLQQSYSYQPGQAGTGSYKKGGMYGWMKSIYQNPYMHRQ